ASANGPSGAIVVNGSQGFLVSAQVADTQVAQVHPGQSALITPAGASGSLPGQVSSVAPQGATTQGVVVFPVDIAVSGNPPGLFAGASAQVSIIVSQATGVLTVPTSSVHTVGARNFVFVLDQGKPTRQIVQLGPSDPTRTSVTSGLRAGTPVVLASSRATVPSPNGIKKKGGGAAGLLGGGGGGGGGKRGLRG
ncbi:MAG: efflux RND transporter periplasmic adaptor subunit, partial [Acidimicrobiales bacterium]